MHILLRKTTRVSGLAAQCHADETFVVELHNIQALHKVH